MRPSLLTCCQTGDGKTLTGQLDLHGGKTGWHAMPQPSQQPHPLFRPCNAATPLCTNSNLVELAWRLQALDTARLAPRVNRAGFAKKLGLNWLIRQTRWKIHRLTKSVHRRPRASVDVRVQQQVSRMPFDTCRKAGITQRQTALVFMAALYSKTARD